MDIEKVGNAQIVLLTVLVSFVTSVASSIFTFTAISPKEPEVIPIISTVVEKTFINREEEVVQNNDEEEVIGVVDTNEVNIVPNEADQILISSGAIDLSDAVSKLNNSIVRIGVKEELSEEEEVVKPITRGVFVSSDGSFVVPSDRIKDDVEYVAVTPLGDIYNINLLSKGEFLTTFDIVSNDDEESISIDYINQIQDEDVRIGILLLTLGKQDDLDLLYHGPLTSKGENFLSVAFDISDIQVGTPIINIDGDLIGLVVKWRNNLEILNMSSLNLLTLGDEVVENKEEVIEDDSSITDKIN